MAGRGGECGELWAPSSQGGGPHSSQLCSHPRWLQALPSAHPTNFFPSATTSHPPLAGAQLSEPVGCSRKVQISSPLKTREEPPRPSFFPTFSLFFVRKSSNGPVSRRLSGAQECFLQAGSQVFELSSPRKTNLPFPGRDGPADPATRLHHWTPTCRTQNPEPVEEPGFLCLRSCFSRGPVMRTPSWFKCLFNNRIVFSLS